MTDDIDTPIETPPENDGADGAVEPNLAESLGVTRMSLQELKEKSPADLLAFAESLEIENANSMRKQDMMFAILKALRTMASRFRAPA